MPSPEILEHPETTIDTTPLGGQRPLAEALQGDAFQDAREEARTFSIQLLATLEAALIAAHAALGDRNDNFSAKTRSFIGFHLGQCQAHETELRRI